MNNRLKLAWILTLSTLLLRFASYGQTTSSITGSFQIGVDSDGHQIVFFQGTNQTEYNLQITVECVNENLKQQKSWLLILAEKKSFFVGPKDGWLDARRKIDCLFSERAIGLLGL